MGDRFRLVIYPDGLPAQAKATQPSNVRGTVKRLAAFWLSNNKWPWYYYYYYYYYKLVTRQTMTVN